MPNEQIDNIAAPEQDVSSAPVDSAEAPAPSPTDLAEAFAQLRNTNTEAASDSVDTSGNNNEPVGKHAKPAADNEGTEAEASAPVATDEQGTVEAPASTSTEQPATSENVGGSTASSEVTDYTPARQQLLQGINQQALQNVATRFRENGIRMWEIGDLYTKDEQTGRVSFKNPDDETRDFQSRKEAQDFCDTMNTQINRKFQSEVIEEQRKLLEQAKPTLNMVEFVPIYKGMSEVERSIFDELITPHAVRDATNNIVGFSTDLYAAASQAKSIASRFASQSESQPKAKAAKKEETSGPATDLPAGTGDVASDEPKDLSEAFAMLNKKKKEGGKNA